MITLRHVSKSYDHPVLDDVNLTLQNGYIYVLKGVSGSGKSTLLHLLGGLDQTYDGEILFKNKKLKEMKKKEILEYQNMIGYVFQESLLIPQFSVLENLKLFCDNEASILALSDQFHITNILTSYPETLSNGERQRISIMRTLLSNPAVILMDEPTAALDQVNAFILQRQIAALKSKDRILLISTHDVIFDDIADVVLTLEFGEVKADDLAMMEYESNHEIQSSKKFAFKKIDFLYCFRKYKKSIKKIGPICFSTLLFLLLFLSFTFKFNFESAYENKLESEYPFEMFNISKEMGERLEKQGTELIYYKNYQKKYDEFTVVSHFPQSDSSLAIPNALAYGTFPKSSNEIIVNEELVTSLFIDQEKSSVIGREITIEKSQYEISGILTNNDNILKEIRDSNVYYWNLAGPLIFMDEEIMKKFAEPKNELVMMAKLKDYKLNAEAYQTLFQKGASSYFYRIMSDKIYSMNFIFYLVQACILLIGFMTFVFMYYVIQLDLYHRRRELGYLQILHIHSVRVKRIIRFDYLLKIIPALLLALLLYCFSIYGIRQLMHLPIPFALPLIGMMAFLITIYVLLVVEIPLRNYMKRDILSLINK